MAVRPRACVGRPAEGVRHRGVAGPGSGVRGPRSLGPTAEVAPAAGPWGRLGADAPLRPEAGRPLAMRASVRTPNPAQGPPAPEAAAGPSGPRPTLTGRPQGGAERRDPSVPVLNKGPPQPTWLVAWDSTWAAGGVAPPTPDFCRASSCPCSVPGGRAGGRTQGPGCLPSPFAPVSTAHGT